MATLSAAIVKHRVASVRDVEEALARQALYGGDLATNLLEVADVSESELTRVLAVGLGLEAAPAEELKRPDDAILRLVPAKLAERHGLYPLEERSGTLVLAVSGPLPAEVEADLGFALGVTVEQKAALEVRLRQAIARDYGVPLDLRFERLLAKLDGLMGAMPNPGEQRAGPDAWPLPRPASVIPAGSESDAPPRPAEPASPSPGPTRRTHDRAAAERDLARASTRDQVLGFFFDFCTQYFDYCALFTVQGELAQGRDARGPGRGRARMSELSLPLDLPSALAEVRYSGQYRLARLGPAELDLRMARELERSPGRMVLLVPVLLRNRCVLVVYGDRGEADVRLGDVTDVIALAPVVSAALERLILQKKQSRAPSLPPLPSARSSAPPAPRPEQVSQPSAASARARTLVEALGPKSEPREPASRSLPTPAGQPPPQRGTGPAHVSSVPPQRIVSVAPSAREAEAPPPTERVRVRRGPRAPVRPSYGPLEYRLLRPHPAISDAPKPSVSVARVVSVGGSKPTQSVRPTAAREPETPIPLTRRSSSTLQAVNPAPVLPERRPTPPGIAAASEPPSQPKLELILEARPPEDHTPEIAVSSTELGEDWSIEDGPASTDGKAPLAPTSRYVHYGARAPRRSQPFDDPNLPSIIVDVESDCLALLDRMAAGDAHARELLVQMGEPAARVLAARLPGPLLPSRSGQYAPGGRSLVPSRSGPLLAMLVQLGRAAVTPVVERTQDPDPGVRAWATRVLGELPWPESARAIATRILDQDEQVRAAALGAGRMLQADHASREALRQALLEVASDPAQPVDNRTSALRTVGELRDDRAVPALLPLLDDGNPDLVAAVHRVLVGLTAQDFGPSRFRYANWWGAQQNRHRIEWLIDALTHDAAEIRRTAGEELKAVTKEYFGYYDDLPPADRAAAQQRYRDWWVSRGKALFG